MAFRISVLCVMLMALAASAWGADRTLEVTASAYNSLPGQTEGDPTLAAWGDRLEPGMRAIAVSHDLIELGLGRGAKVRIEGLPGEYVVLDKMASRWRRKIDLYMGVDREAAIAWGIRKVRIRWEALSVPASAPE
jgi:3D (Asp-Asp-Asp) domain-containing protein